MNAKPMAARAYLDHNAGSPLRPAARAAVMAALDLTGNPSSVHADGRAARRIVEDARADVAALVGASPAQVVFTGSGTEANNHALTGTGRANLLVSAIEHDSVLEAARSAVRVPVTPAGVVDLEALERLLAGDAAPALVSIMLVNNETGVVQPVAEAARIAHAHGALVHCDGVQAAGRLAIEMSDLDVDLLSLSAHKLGGPKGVGALVVRDGMGIDALLRGGGQERRRRAGTENVAGIAGFGAAAREALSGIGDADRLARLRDGLEAGIRAACADAGVYGAGTVRVGNTSCIGMPGVPAETQLMAFDLAGLSVSTGAACSSGKVRASHVLVAMGVPAEETACAVRVSLGWSTGDADVARLVEAWTALHRRRAS